MKILNQSSKAIWFEPAPSNPRVPGPNLAQMPVQYIYIDGSRDS